MSDALEKLTLEMRKNRAALAEDLDNIRDQLSRIASQLEHVANALVTQ
jgi:hypothetical protein